MRGDAADTLVAEALRQLDAAPEAELTEAERARADALVDRIVATPATPETGAVPVETVRPHRRRRLMTVAGGAGAAAAVASALLLGGGTAYGSWTPRPEPLTGSAAAQAAASCRAAMEARDGGARVALAERRGEWTYVLLAGGATELSCLMPNDLVAATSVGPGDFFGSYDTDAPAPPSVAPDDIDETSSMQGSTDEGWFSLTEGYVGSDVIGVTVHVSSGLDIEASVSGNRFAAWWPSTVQSSDNPAETWTYTVRLADGSTRRAD